MRKTLWFGMFAASLISAALVVQAADHKDSPALESDPATDIGDVYAFKRGQNLVVAMTVQSLRVSGNATDLFDTNARYQFFVDNTDNSTLAADATITVKFSGSNPQMFSVSGLTPEPITGPTTGFDNANTPIVTDSSGIKIFAGVREDPFFFDLAGFRQFLAGTYTPVSGLRDGGNQPPRDGFAETNVAAIVIELPITSVTGLTDPNLGVIRAWASTSVLQ